MKKNRTSRTSLGYGPYTQFAHGQSYRAIPFSADITVEGLWAGPYRHDLTYQIRESMDSIGYDILTRGRATRQFCLIKEPDCKSPQFLIVDSSRKEIIKESPVALKTVEIKSSEFGIKPRSVRNLVRKLSRMQMPPTDNDFVRRSKLSDMMADRAGSVIFWTLTESSKFTDPFILITHCHLMMLAIRICKRVEKEINDFLSEAKVEATVMVPTYSLEELSNSLKAFNEGRLPIDAFSDIVFKRNA